MRASRGEMNNIIAVARAWVSAFSLRLLVQLRLQDESEHLPIDFAASGLSAGT